MILSLLGLKPAAVPAHRLGAVLDRGRATGVEHAIFGRRRPGAWREVSASEHLYFAVRSVVADGRGHVLQYAFVDDRGHVALSASVRTPSPVLVVGAPASEDLPAPPLEPEAFEDLALKLCAGATLVAFHRVLQTGLLPAGATIRATGTECAWRRFQAVARRKGLRLSRQEPLTLNDCLEKAGLPSLDSEDAALRALAVRALWRWMDAVE
jgi:hypothetical protein